MRDPQFITLKRGGSLTPEHHRLMMRWAATCAQRVLHLFEQDRRDDSRPADAIALAHAWSQSETPIKGVRDAAVACHAAARDCTQPDARSAARAAAHAVATGHMADHCIGGASYALLALQQAGLETQAERAWQDAQIPDAIRPAIASLETRRTALR